MASERVHIRFIVDIEGVVTEDEMDVTDPFLVQLLTKDQLRGLTMERTRDRQESMQRIIDNARVKSERNRRQ